MKWKEIEGVSFGLVNIRFMQQTFFSFILLVLFSACSSFGQSNAGGVGDIVSARRAYNAAKHELAYQQFESIWKDSEAVEADRLEAGRHLVKMNWRLYDNHKKAHKLLDKLEKEASELGKAFALRSRLFADENELEKAIVAARKGVSLSVGEAELLKAVLAYGTAVLALSAEELNETGNLSANMIETLTVAQRQLADWLTDKPDNFYLARLQLGHALLLGKGEEALSAWRLFFRLNEVSQVHPSLIAEPNAFELALRSWQGSVAETKAKVLIKGLAESGFIDCAMLVKQMAFARESHDDPEISALEHYATYLDRLDATVKHFYKGTVRGEVDVYDLNKAFNEDSEWLWNQMIWRGSRPKYSRSAFIKEVRKRYKGLILFNTVDSFYGLHVGQIILDDKRIIRQYGQEAEFQYTLIEHALTNGYVTWFTDGENAVGGWASSTGAFVQVRTGLNSKVTELWAMLEDPVERKKMAEQVARMSQGEEARARKNPYAYLPGLQFRLILEDSRAVVDSLRATGLSGNALRYTFISYMESMAEAAKIYAHEGRHSIDMKYKYQTGSANLEYTAKLSEIYFADRPFFMLGTLISSNLGNGTAHGDANLRLIKGIVGWMEANQSKIEGFDPTKPTLPQVGKMTAAQLKQAVRSLDPLANQ